MDVSRLPWFHEDWLSSGGPSPCCSSICFLSCSRGPQTCCRVLLTVFPAHLQIVLFMLTPQSMQRPLHEGSQSDDDGISRWIVSRKYFEMSTSLASRGKWSLSSKSRSKTASPSSSSSPSNPYLLLVSAPSTTPTVCCGGSLTGFVVKVRLKVANTRSATGARHLANTVFIPTPTLSNTVSHLTFPGWEIHILLCERKEGKSPPTNPNTLRLTLHTHMSEFTGCADVCKEFPPSGPTDCKPSQKQSLWFHQVEYLALL